MSFTSKLRWFNDEERPWVFDPFDQMDGADHRTSIKPGFDANEMMDIATILPTVGVGGKAALGAKTVAKKSFKSFTAKKAAKKAELKTQKSSMRKFKAETREIGKQTQKTHKVNNAMENASKTKKAQDRRQQTQSLRNSTKQARRVTDKPSARSQETAKIVNDLAEKSFAAFKNSHGGAK